MKKNLANEYDSGLKGITEQLNYISFHQANMQTNISANKKALKNIKNVYEKTFFEETKPEEIVENPPDYIRDYNILTDSMFKLNLLVNTKNYQVKNDGPDNSNTLLNVDTSVISDSLEVTYSTKISFSLFIKHYLQKCSTLTVNLPSRTEIEWDDIIILPPNFRLIIVGNESAIYMNKNIVYQDVDIPTRLVIPLSSRFEISSTIIEIDFPQCIGINDWKSVFVVTGYNLNGIGVSSIRLENVSIFSNLNFINVGLHGFAHIICKNVICNSDKLIIFISRRFMESDSKAVVFVTNFNFKNSRSVTIKGFQ